MKDPNTREALREAVSLVTGIDGDPEQAATKAYDLLYGLPPEELALISGALQVLTAAVEMTRRRKLMELARSN